MTSDRKDNISEEKASLEALRSHNDRLGALASIAARIGVYQDTRRLAREAMQAIADLMPIKAALLLLADSKSGSLSFHEGFNLHMEEIERFHRLRSWDDCIEGDVVRGKEPVLIEDVSSDSRAIHYPGGAMSLGLVPLLTRERVVGVLSVTTASDHRLDQYDMEFLLTLGSQLGTYLENARLLEELTSSNQRLVRQNQDLEELLSVISHDLRSPLATIGGYASLLSKKNDSLKPDERVQFAETIFRKTTETSRRFDDLLSIFQAGGASENGDASEVDLEIVIDEALEEADPEGQLTRFTIEVPEHLPRLVGHGTHLLHLFTNLFSNAIKFMGHNEDPRIIVKYERVSETGDIKHRFSVSDNGPGIPEDYLANIFRPFTRVPSEEDIPGTGIGLSSVQKIVRSQGGTVDIESVEGQGTTVSFTLPWEEVEKNVESQA